MPRKPESVVEQFKKLALKATDQELEIIENLAAFQRERLKDRPEKPAMEPMKEMSK